MRHKEITTFSCSEREWEVDIRLPNNASGNLSHITPRAKQAGVKFFTPHGLRRAFVRNLLDAGVDVETVAKMACHANIQTTAIYDRRPEGARQRAARLLYIPYSGRPDKAKNRRIREHPPVFRSDSGLSTKRTGEWMSSLGRENRQWN